MRTFIAILASAVTAFPGVYADPAFAQESEVAPQQSLLQTFTGTWRAEGTSFGAPSKSTMVWREALDGKFYRLTYTIEMQRGDEVQTFVGHGYYQRGSSQGFWADNGGDLHPMVATYTDTALTTIWGKAGGKQGRSSYTLQEDDRIEVADWILTDDGWREFNRTMFSRLD